VRSAGKTRQCADNRLRDEEAHVRNNRGDAVENLVATTVQFEEDQPTPLAGFESPIPGWL
jgi:hypothetical protein